MLQLYDPDRAQSLMFNGEIRGWADFHGALVEGLARQRAGGLLDYVVERTCFAIVQSLSITASSVSKKSYSPHP